MRPDSRLILHAARQVVEEEGFDELLDNVRDRVDEIESLHRTREVTFKDLGEVSVQPPYFVSKGSVIHYPRVTSSDSIWTRMGHVFEESSAVIYIPYT